MSSYDLLAELKARMSEQTPEDRLLREAGLGEWDALSSRPSAIVVHVGALGSYAMTSRKWSSERQLAEITFENESGIRFETTALGMSDHEVTRAILDDVVRLKVGPSKHGDRCPCTDCT